MPSRTVALTPGWALALAQLSIAAALPAQQVAPAMPITVLAAPSRIMAAGSTTISGTTALAGNTSGVALKVLGPNGAVVLSTSLKPSATGAYSTRFAKTDAVGSYTVRVTAPDGKGSATTTFSVVAPGVIPDLVARKADSLVLAATKVMANIRQGIDGMAPSPAKDQAKARVAEAEAKVAQLPAQVGVLRKQLTDVFQARAKAPKPIPEWDGYLDEMSRWEQDATAARAKLDKLAQPSAQGTEGCADLDRYNEMLTLTSEAINYVKAPFDLSKAFFSDKIPGGLVARAGADGLSSGERFALVQSMKLAVSALEGPAGLVSAVPGFLLDTGQFLLQQGFAKYCEKWEGPIKATFLGESFTRQGEPFFDYTIELEGKLMLLYAKGVPKGAPVKLSGFLEGTGRFSIRDNPKPVARLVPGTVLFHRIQAPPGGGYWDEIGMASRSLAPHGFRIPVTGIMAGDSVLFQLGAADHDFGATIKGLSTWVIMPAGGLVPQVINSAFDLQKAHPIIERVVRRRPVLRITISGTAMTATGSFSRDTTNADKTARVRTTLTIKACNPGCVPLPFTPGAKKP
ncbi:MAG: hypothetical protein AAB075_02270 [Gemmatimonadota bacterium]